MEKKQNFYSLETLGGVLLFTSAIIALIIANSPWQNNYDDLLSASGSIGLGNFGITKPLMLWINDGLMAIYFLLVGLEIKREVLRGILSSKTSIFVPAFTATCGLLLPALIFTILNAYNPIYLRGWAIPTATDIAFTLGILALLGSRVPTSLKVLLTAIAIFDDIGAIVIIAIFYTSHLSYLSLGFAALLTITLFLLNYYRVDKVSIYIFFGILLWMAVLKSGVHATLSGIILAMAIPDGGQNSILNKLEKNIHPWVVFLILPVFAFANAGVSFSAFTADVLSHTIVLGIILGLVIGKQIGIFLPLYYFVRFKNFLQKDRINTQHIYGIALICGVGFTMSLFIGTLAYHTCRSSLIPLVKIGVLCGSTLAGTLGYLILRFNKTKG